MPTRRDLSSANATTEGVVRAPSEFSITRAVRPSTVGGGGGGGREGLDMIKQEWWRLTPSPCVGVLYFLVRFIDVIDGFYGYSIYIAIFIFHF